MPPSAAAASATNRFTSARTAASPWTMTALRPNSRMAAAVASADSRSAR